MTRAMLALLMSAACGGGSSAGKTEVACGASWTTSPPIAGTCDSACAEMTAGSGASCTTTVVYTGGTEYVCLSTFVDEGVRGCCLDIGRVGQISGLDEPQRQRRVFFLSCSN